MAVQLKTRLNIADINVSDLLQNLELGVGQAAVLCGITIRQLSYWTDKGIVSTMEQYNNRTYDFKAIEKIMLIKQVIDAGYNLESANSEVEHYLAIKESRQPYDMNILNHILPAENYNYNRDIQDDPRCSYENETKNSGPNMKDIERIIMFFQENPFTITTAREVAIRLGRNQKDVENDLLLLEKRRFLQRIAYKHADVYRYIPTRENIK